MKEREDLGPDFEQMLLERPVIREKLRWFEYGHLPDGTPRAVSAFVAGLAIELICDLRDGDQLEEGLQRLLEAKDCFVRQAIQDGGDGQ